MTLEKLRALAQEARHLPHYQFRDVDDATFLEYAKKSFHNIKPDHQEKVQKSWADALSKASPAEELNELTANELLTLRFLAQTNLFFLCKLLEKYDQVTVNTHEEICNDFFVQKDPRFTTFEKFANQYTDLKDRMLLVPRGGFKSSLNMADCVQWVISYPAITILILTGVYQLAGDFVGEVRSHFTFEEAGFDTKTNKPVYGPRKLMDKETGAWTASMFQTLFPEHCILPGTGTQHEFQTPAVADDKEPTVRAASIEQALVGMHFGVLKLDDVVTNENSQTLDRLLKINKQISIDRAMLHPYGFMDVIGTWYDEKDYYGETIKSEEKLAAEDGLLGNIIGTVDSGRFNSNVNVKIYLRSAWWFNDEAIKAGRIEAEATKKDYDLWFPERLSYEFLLKEKKTEKSEGGFEIKYLNNPRKINKVKFPRELLTRRTIPHNQLPPQGIVVTTVDTAYSTKSWADYTVILTAFIYGGRFYIINMVRGRFNEFELPAVIAATANKWKPKRIAIEDSVGVKWMGRELKREMDKLQISIPVEFVSLGLGNKSKSKALKAKPVVRLLGDERMYFLNSCEGLQEIYTELEKFTGTSDDAHDDIVSALSLLVEQFGAYADIGSKVDFGSSQYVADKQSSERHDLVYGLGKYSKYNVSNSDNPTTVFQTETDRRFRDDMMPGEIDPLGDLMQ
jgi:predicted phage terminase large subunit-like protein